VKKLMGNNIVSKNRKQSVKQELSAAENKPKLGPGYREEWETEANKKIFLNALEGNLGLVIRASRATGIPSITHYYWMDKDPIYKEKVEKLIELKRDHVENQLITLVDEKEPSCVTFTAKCLLRKRGYDQTTEIRNADGESFHLNIPAAALNQALKTIYENADNEDGNAGDSNKR
jgi:hypothetical protein